MEPPQHGGHPPPLPPRFGRQPTAAGDRDLPQTAWPRSPDLWVAPAAGILALVPEVPVRFLPPPGPWLRMKGERGGWEVRGCWVGAEGQKADLAPGHVI